MSFHEGKAILVTPVLPDLTYDLLYGVGLDAVDLDSLDESKDHFLEGSGTMVGDRTESDQEGGGSIAGLVGLFVNRQLSLSEMEINREKITRRKKL